VRHWAWPVDPGVTVAGYTRFRTEIDPAPVLVWLATQGARLCLPVTPAAAKEGLTFHPYTPGDGLTKSRLGVWEPTRAAPAVRPDIVLVPLLGFDAACRRLGYGQGHYDRTLEALRAEGQVLAIGLAFSAQRISALPVEAHDQPLDAVLTPDGALTSA
jgi:5-formyltetrahydrofolate cyclo-ligase